MDLKSIGFSRTGSNPVNVVFYLLSLNIFNNKIKTQILSLAAGVSYFFENFVYHQEHPFALWLSCKYEPF